MKPLKDLRRVVAIRTGGGTERAHGVKHHGSYSVAEHTWGVLCLLFALYPDDYARISPFALFHDVPEAWVGDVPAPTKMYSVSVKIACDTLERAVHEWLRLPCDLDLGDEDRRILKACDHLELYLWTMEQVHGGNLHALCLMRELDRFFEERPLEGPAARLYNEMQMAGPAATERATDGVISMLAREHRL